MGRTTSPTLWSRPQAPSRYPRGRAIATDDSFGRRLQRLGPARPLVIRMRNTQQSRNEMIDRDVSPAWYPARSRRSEPIGLALEQRHA
jgi:hypothetical protein